MAAAVTLLSTVAVGASAAPAQAAPPTSSVTKSTVSPEGPLAASTTSAKQAADLKQRLQAKRAGMAAAAAGTPAAKAKTAPTAAQTGLSRPGTTTALRAQLLRRNNANTIAPANSVLAEPVAANDGNSVFYAGNGPYQSTSTNLGVSWTNVAVPAGPADAPNAIGDWDALRAHSRDRTISSLLYVNSALSNGVVRIFVRSAPESAPLCTYLIDPAGTANNVLPDYPHIAASANFLYLAMNNVGSSWVGAQVRRFDLTQMSACQTAGTTTFTYTGTVGQRVLTPVEGAQGSTTMYFASQETASQLRLFSWPESAAAPTETLRNVATVALADADCRGGTNNTDFVAASNITAIGFGLRGTIHGGRVTWFRQSANDAAHPQAYVRTSSFRTSDLALQEEPDIWNDTFCFAFAAVSGNNFGDLGLSIAIGGRAGGGGSAVQGAIGNDDTPGGGIHFGNVSVTAAGTHNPSNGRFGDYFSVRTNARCTRTWVATNYALNGSATTVNARYVEFGSDLDSGCF